MNDLTGRLARASSRRPGRTLAAWGVVLVLSIAAIGGLLGSSLTTDAEMTNDPESYRAYDLIAEHFPPSDDYVNDVVVIRSPTLDVSNPEFRSKVEALVDEDRGDRRRAAGANLLLDLAIRRSWRRAGVRRSCRSASAVTARTRSAR